MTALSRGCQWQGSRWRTGSTPISCASGSSCARTGRRPRKRCRYWVAARVGLRSGGRGRVDGAAAGHVGSAASGTSPRDGVAAERGAAGA